MTNAKKSDLIALLKGATVKKDKKALTVRFPPELFEEIEKLVTKDSNLNSVILALIELGLDEVKKA